ncbi:NUDIX domain-containing protein [Tateyamaria sp. syn59]|uniref:NUDIX domain-containing protein n=1 Tax=Tateyamaria sp. syn59 TaxID=2576942 RepID=UPI0011BF9015|nr:NUDIX domain-containing protein [Tateyamaria sp. syn59]
MTVRKALVFILRGPDILVFRHPLAGVQLPKGTVEAHETTLAAARREVFEEVGLVLTGPLIPLGAWVCPSLPATWHVFVADAPSDAPDEWRHAPTGGGEEDDLTFDVFWTEAANARTLLHPLFLPVLDMLEQYARSR